MWAVLEAAEISLVTVYENISAENIGQSYTNFRRHANSKVFRLFSLSSCKWILSTNSFSGVLPSYLMNATALRELICAMLRIQHSVSSIPEQL
jgi:hypothetical protein